MKQKRVKGLYVDKNIVWAKIKEAFTSVLPISLIVFLLCVTIVPAESGRLLSFLIGAMLSTIGIGLFTLGADTSMTPIGEYVGKTIINTKKLWIILPAFFFVGIFITISEPDLAVLAEQLSNSIGHWLLIITIGVGVGVLLVVAILRIVLRIRFNVILIVLYVLTFALSFYAPKQIVPLAFDSGGVTTGPMSVPFIIAIGTGVAMMRTDKNASNDSFGLTALCSIGPILSVMILGIILKPQITTVADSIIIPETARGVVGDFVKALPKYLKEVGIALLPMVCFFFITRIFGTRISRSALIKIFVGVAYTYVGLVLFLTGVNCGFAPMGNFIGKAIAGSEYQLIIIPIGIIIGFFVVAAEPAVHVLTNQVYEITSGMIPKKALLYSLMIGTAVSCGLAMLRIVLGVDLMYFLIPGYLIALVLTFFVPEIFTAIAFDSGGVASGAMTSGFLLPLALGVNVAVGGSAESGFGLVALVAMTPLITIQILGLIFRIKLKRVKAKSTQDNQLKEQIID
ncbi:MAG: DUF1538 domain-containing protein [Clostridia bacterium]|nr:DUF1538 domain-containing protein [Clostridia bacterium]